MMKFCKSRALFFELKPGRLSSQGHAQMRRTVGDKYRHVPPDGIGMHCVRSAAKLRAARVEPHNESAVAHNALS
jgi:hypothetical protein